MNATNNCTVSISLYANLIRGICLSFLLIVYRAYISFTTGGITESIFSDHDEMLYVRYHLSIGAIPWSQLTSVLPQRIQGLTVFMPHLLVDVVLGKLHSVLGLSPATILLYLDFVVVLLTYIIMTRVFVEVVCCSRRAELMSLCYICFPFLLYLPGWFGTIPLSFGINDPFDPWMSLPSHRGIYTQVSYPIVGLSLLWAFRSVKGKSSIVGAVCAGIFTGLLLYAYFFAFIAVAALVCLMFVLQALRTKRLRPLLIFGLVAASIALPGIFLIFKTNPDSLMKIPQEYLYIPYVNLVATIEIVVLFIVISVRRAESTRRDLLRFCLVAQLALFLTVNLQFLVSRNITAYHIPVFYLIPLITTLYLSVALTSLRLSYVRLLYCLMFGFALLAENLRIISFNSATNLSIVSLVNCVSQGTDKFWAFPFRVKLGERSELGWTVPPYAVAALARRDNWELEHAIGNYQEFIKIESVYGWLLTGEPSLIAMCPDLITDYPDFYTTFGYWQLLRRKQLCEFAQGIDIKKLFCEHVKELQPQLFIEIEDFVLSSSLSDFVRKSDLCPTGGGYLIDFPRLYAEYCESFVG